MSAWADLRQVVLATTEPEPVVARLRRELRLGRTFGDPELAAHGIGDDTLAVGADTYLEVVHPLTPEHPMATWVASRGGTAGYLLSVQVSDVDACLARCAEDGVRITHTQLVQGHRIAQLHPGDVSVSLELDGIAERGRWFWDALDVDRPTGARVDDVVAVELAVDEPDAVAQRWARVLGIDPVDGTSIPLGSRLVRFVAAGTRKGITGVDLHAVDRASDPGIAFDLGSVTFHLV